jgi:hypothetical protein
MEDSGSAKTMDEAERIHALPGVHGEQAVLVPVGDVVFHVVSECGQSGHQGEKFVLASGFVQFDVEYYRVLLV